MPDVVIRITLRRVTPSRSSGISPHSLQHTNGAVHGNRSVGYPGSVVRRHYRRFYEGPGTFTLQEND